ncbi:hypothetical protein CPB85DRAFT_1431210 [Mucidula mucida]|nr:hypothetical protein CPB85DRAFT_1431210 [Mucidula mucida]
MATAVPPPALGDAPQWGLDMEHIMLWSIYSLRVNIANEDLEHEKRYVAWSPSFHLQHKARPGMRNVYSIQQQSPHKDTIFALELPSPLIPIVKPLPSAPGEPPNRPPDIVPDPPAAGVHPLIPNTMDALNNLSGPNLTALLLAYNVPGKVPRSVRARRVRFAQFIGVTGL